MADIDKIQETTMFQVFDNTTQTIQQSDYQTHVIVYAVLIVILILAICFGNGLSIAAIVCSERLRQTQYFVLHLAISDFCVGIFLVMHVVTFLYEEQLTRVMEVCVFRYTSLFTCMAASLLCLLCITLDRHTAIFLPLHYETYMSKYRRYTLICLVWIIAISLGFLTPMFWHNKADKCRMILVIKSDYFLCIIFPVYGTASAAIFIMYGRIFYQARKVAKATNKRENGQHVSPFKKEYKLAKTAAFVIGAFLCSWSPFFFITGVQILRGRGMEDTTLETLRNYTQIQAVVNSALNPLIYAFRMHSFRHEFRRILRIRSIRVETISPTQNHH